MPPLKSSQDGGIQLPSGFHWSPVDYSGKAPKDVQDPPLGVLDKLKCTSFSGTGFNTIFRPLSTTDPNPTVFALLALNLTQETLVFSAPLGQVPNRGLLN